MTDITTVAPESTLPVNTKISTVLDSDGAHMSNVVVMLNGAVDSNNSSSTLLGISEVFTGTATDVTEYVSIRVSVSSDQQSATDGLSIQFSQNQVNWHETDAYTYDKTDQTLKTWNVQRPQQYFRVVYTNGAVAQTHFHLDVFLEKNSGVVSSHRVADTISGQDDAALTKTIIMGLPDGGTDFQNIPATPEGILKTSVVEPTGVLPVAQLTTLHDGKILNREFTEVNETAGTATFNYSNNKHEMSVTSGQWGVIQTRRFLPYFSGKPQKIELTFDNFAPETNVTKRVGYFSSGIVSPFDSGYDGIWLESSGGTIALKAERNGVSTIDEDITDWLNYDVLSEYQTMATWDNFTVIEINFLWLGGAYIELRLMTSNGFITAHNVIYAGTAQDVFILSPNQPVRYEIRSTTGTGNFRYICNQVATAGSVNESAYSKGVDTGSNSITLSSQDTKYPLIAVKKGASYRDNPIKINNLGILITTNDDIRWTLEINPTLSAGLSYTAVANSAIESANGNGTITVTTAGIIIASGHITQNTPLPTNVFDTNFLAFLSGELDGTQDEYVLCATPTSNNLQVFGSIGLVEA